VKRSVPALQMLAALVPGCGTLHHRQPLPEALSDQAQPPGYADIRDWGDEPSPADYRPESTDDFYFEQMKRLFALGRQVARDGYPWLKAPPGYEPAH
jgi:hypothetical protein